MDELELKAPEFDDEKAWLIAENKLMSKGVRSSPALHMAYLMGSADASKHHKGVILGILKDIQKFLADILWKTAPDDRSRH